LHSAGVGLYNQSSLFPSTRRHTSHRAEDSMIKGNNAQGGIWETKWKRETSVSRIESRDRETTSGCMPGCDKEPKTKPKPLANQIQSAKLERSNGPSSDWTDLSKIGHQATSKPAYQPAKQATKLRAIKACPSMLNHSLSTNTTRDGKKAHEMDFK
jgi:hypothetical protein